MTREHALHVAIQNRDALSLRERGDRRSGRAADAGQRCQARGVAREFAAMLSDDLLRRCVKMMRAAVIPETAPRAKHVVDRCASERTDVGKRRNESFEIRDDRRDLRLLQHDLGEPDRIWVAECRAHTLGAAPLPRQIAAPMNTLPGDDAGRESCTPTLGASLLRCPLRGPVSRLGTARRREILGHFHAISECRAAASPSPRLPTAGTSASAPRACGARRRCRSNPIAPMRRSAAHPAPWGSSDSWRSAGAAR